MIIAQLSIANPSSSGNWLLGYFSQRASDHARSVNATLAAHYGNAQAAAAAYKGKGIELTRDAQARVHALSSSMLTELEKLQVSPSPSSPFLTITTRGLYRCRVFPPSPHPIPRTPFSEPSSSLQRSEYRTDCSSTRRQPPNSHSTFKVSSSPSRQPSPQQPRTCARSSPRTRRSAKRHTNLRVRCKSAQRRSSNRPRAYIRLRWTSGRTKRTRPKTTGGVTLKLRKRAQGTDPPPLLSLAPVFGCMNPAPCSTLNRLCLV